MNEKCKNSVYLLASIMYSHDYYQLPSSISYWSHAIIFFFLHFLTIAPLPLPCLVQPGAAALHELAVSVVVVDVEGGEGQTVVAVHGVAGVTIVQVLVIQPEGVSLASHPDRFRQKCFTMHGPPGLLKQYYASCLVYICQLSCTIEEMYNSCMFILLSISANFHLHFLCSCIIYSYVSILEDGNSQKLRKKEKCKLR